MKEKKLYSTAIIPDELYVHRNADRKLKEVILRMSKPAYISVARQMGKTNLLIQTKRTLENESNRYVYIDVTNKFESAQDCFRYIVNQILNSNEEIKEFQEASEYILKSRQITSNNPTEEYQNEIREILKRFKGNLVVFLDEVDDLRKHSFSDDIFGQIRKTYFINETYPVLKRITYILSGVIDPEKLIKTKDNSPFNIAIPIYLDDFNYDEFLELINKSELILEPEIKEYIYDWLKGNPRMSFEILSLIEDEIINGNIINKVVVDKVINDFYLTNYKNPPIDHIRDLIKHNTEVRKALIKLKNGQTNDLSDEIINKFYLFGITSTKINKENISIKNKVIELSLSDDWLEKIEVEKKGYYTLGKEKISQGYFEDGILLLKEYLQNEPKGSFSSLSKHDIGKAYYSLGEHEFSNQYLIDKPIIKEESSVLYFWQVFYIGANFMKLGKFEKGLPYLDEIINDAPIPQIKINAYVNKGEILINSDINYEIPAVISNYLKALTFFEENQDRIEEQNKLLTIIYYRLGILYSKNKQNTDAIESFENALKFAEDKEKPIIYLYIDSSLEPNSLRKEEIYRKLPSLIINRALEFNEESDIIIPFNEIQLLVICADLLEYKLENEFNELSKYSLEILYKSQIKEYELLYKVATFSVNSNNLNVGEILLKRILEFPNVDANTQKYCHQIIGLISGNKKESLSSLKHLTEYVKLFEELSDKNTTLEVIDFNAFIAVIDHYRKSKKYKEGFEIASIIEKQFNGNLNSENKANSVVILFYIMDYYSFIGNIPSTIQYGEKVLSLIAEVRPILNELSYVDKKGLDDIEKQTNTILRRIKGIKPIEPIRVNRELGRNEYVKVRYKNGHEITTKYKKVFEDIRKGECHLIQ
ncbi:MAG TPA: tetratricopeptide repeat protein [Prolixibacteraceae bacterium]|nr:tetratricopeptide repeat protein [Prolixibacteraceae bacterium]